MNAFILLATAALAIQIQEPNTIAPEQEERCIEGCVPHMLGNGICDPPCNVGPCDFDHGDCETSNVTGPNDQECAPGCLWDMTVNGVCDTTCDNDLCAFDGGACN